MNTGYIEFGFGGLARGIKRATSKVGGKGNFANPKPMNPKMNAGRNKAISPKNSMGRDFGNQNLNKNIIGQRRQTFKSREEARMFAGIQQKQSGGRNVASSGRNINAGYTPKRGFGWGRRRPKTSQRRQLI